MGRGAAREASQVVRGFGPLWFRRALAGVAVMYFSSTFASSAGISLDERLFPHTFRYFTRIACLFPRAKPLNIDYRVHAFDCSARRYTELDTRPYFPLRPDDKENRLYRSGHFFRRNQTVMRALDTYLVDKHNARAALGEVEPIGGIAFSSLRIPLPEAGTRVERYRRRPVSEYPATMRKLWYQTDAGLREDRCKEWQW